MLNWLVYICFGVGLILIIYALVILRERPEAKNDFDMERIMEAMDRSINDADSATNELAKLSQDVVTEIDDKYQQLLYLYSLIEEKSEKLGSDPSSRSHGNPSRIDVSIDESFDYRSKKQETTRKAIEKGFNPNLVSDKYRSVFELHDKGMSIPEIARSLSIGQGEVKLVLELGKGR